MDNKEDELDVISSGKLVLQNVKDLLYELDHAVRLKDYRLAHVVEIHDDGTYDLSYDGIIEYNVPGKLLRRPGEAEVRNRANMTPFKTNEVVEGPVGWGTTKDVQLPTSILWRHKESNMMTFNIADPSKIKRLVCPVLADMHPLAIKHFEEGETGESIEPGGQTTEKSSVGENEGRGSQHGGGGGRSGADQSDFGEMKDIFMMRMMSELFGMTTGGHTQRSVVSPAPSHPALPQNKPELTPRERLMQLRELLEAGLITQADYDVTKQEVLSLISSGRFN